MLVTDYVTPELTEELKARRIAFLDTAGNAYFEQPTLKRCRLEADAASTLWP
jgi:hypothetical protein